MDLNVWGVGGVATTRRQYRTVMDDLIALDLIALIADSEKQIRKNFLSCIFTLLPTLLQEDGRISVFRCTLQYMLRFTDAEIISLSLIALITSTRLNLINTSILGTCHLVCYKILPLHVCGSARPSVFLSKSEFLFPR